MFKLNKNIIYILFLSCVCQISCKRDCFSFASSICGEIDYNLKKEYWVVVSCQLNPDSDLAIYSNNVILKAKSGKEYDQLRFAVSKGGFSKINEIGIYLSSRTFRTIDKSSWDTTRMESFMKTTGDETVYINFNLKSKEVFFRNDLDQNL